MSHSSKQLYLIGLPILTVAVVYFAFHGESESVEQLKFNEVGVSEIPVAVSQGQPRYVVQERPATVQLPEIRFDFLAQQVNARLPASNSTDKSVQNAPAEKLDSPEQETSRPQTSIALTSPGRRQPSGKIETIATTAVDGSDDDTVRSTAYQEGESEINGGGDFAADFGPQSVLAPGSDDEAARFHAAPPSDPPAVRGLTAPRHAQRVARREVPESSVADSPQSIQKSDRTFESALVESTQAESTQAQSNNNTFVPVAGSRFVQSQRPAETVSQSPVQGIVEDQAISNTSTLPPAIATQIGQRLQYGTSLAKRGAFASAEEIYFQVIRLIAETKDSQYGTRSHTQALAAGLTAFEEAQDFVSSDLRTRVRLDVANIVQTHSTELLHDEDCSSMTTIQALQRYYEYVGGKFVEACDGEPVASDSLYYLGKLYSINTQTDPSTLAMQNAKSMIMQQAAIEANNLNHRASNELGVLLARYGRFDDARDMLIHSVSITPDSVAWRNLASIHEQLGEKKLASLAMNESRISMQQSVAQRGRVSEGSIQWVDPVAFSQMPGSPQEMMAQKPQQPQSTTQQPAPRVSERPSTKDNKQWWQVWKR